MRARTATTDVEIEGIAIAAGERVLAINAAANRDPARWARPAELDPDRPRLWGHLAFNVGPRHCAGAHLARLEATEALLGMWRAFPDLARAPGASPPASMGFVSRAWRPIELVHAPVAADAAGRRIMDGPPWAGSVPSGAAGVSRPATPPRPGPTSTAGY
jgi:cytochrome P450